VRRAVELVPELGLAWANCAAGDVSSDRCAGVEGGAEFSFWALWRVSPYFAWGGGFELAGFRYDPPQALGLRNASAAAVFLGFIGRAYFLDSGAFDPYVQLGLGGGALGTSSRASDGNIYGETGAGPAVQIGGGLDFFVSSRLRLGPSVAYTQVFVDKIRRCPSGGSEDCVDIAKDQGHLNAFVGLGVRLSLLLGAEM